MHKILVIEDDQDILDLVCFHLQKGDYRCWCCQRGDEGLRLARQNKPDLIVLDLTLPGMDGIGVLRELRHNPDTRQIRVLILSAKTEEVDRILGFELGADDYVTKPFSNRELVLRVKSILSRTKSGLAPETLLRCEAIVVDLNRYHATVADTPVLFTATEFIC